MSANTGDEKKATEARWAIVNDYFNLRRATEKIGIKRGILMRWIISEGSPEKNQLTPEQIKLLENIRKNLKLFAKLKKFEAFGLSAEERAFNDILKFYQFDRNWISYFLKSLFEKNNSLTPQKVMDLLQNNPNKLLEFFQDIKDKDSRFDYEQLEFTHKKLCYVYKNAPNIVQFDAKDQYDKLVLEGKIKPALVEQPNVAATPNVPGKQQQAVAKRPSSPNAVPPPIQLQQVMPLTFETKSKVASGIAAKMQKLSESRKKPVSKAPPKPGAPGPNPSTRSPGKPQRPG